jgi:hypothetical protein
VIVFFLFDTAGYFLLFCLRQDITRREIRREIRMGLKEGQLTLITVTGNDESGISWIEPGREFRFRGEMYDVVKIRTENQAKYYYCIKDVKEKQLIAEFNKSRKAKKEDGKKREIFNFQYLPAPFSTGSSPSSAGLLTVEPAFFYQSENPDVNSPPPKRSGIQRA